VQAHIDATLIPSVWCELPKGLKQQIKEAVSFEPIRPDHCEKRAEDNGDSECSSTSSRVIELFYSDWVPGWSPANSLLLLH